MDSSCSSGLGRSLGQTGGHGKASSLVASDGGIPRMVITFHPSIVQPNVGINRSVAKCNRWVVLGAWEGCRTPRSQ